MADPGYGGPLPVAARSLRPDFAANQIFTYLLTYLLSQYFDVEMHSYNNTWPN